MQHNGWNLAPKVTADGKGLVGHAGAVLLPGLIGVLLRPSAQASTIRARSASPCAVFRRFA
jgi:hypothetical protein